MAPDSAGTHTDTIQARERRGRGASKAFEALRGAGHEDRREVQGAPAEEVQANALPQVQGVLDVREERNDSPASKRARCLVQMQGVRGGKTPSLCQIWAKTQKIILKKSVFFKFAG